MAQKIGIISDIHATPAPLEEALSIFQRQGVATVICAGDIAGYGDALAHTIDLLSESGCHSILGNHDVWYLDRHVGEKETENVRFFNNLPYVLKLMLEGLKLYVVHASPPRSLMKGIHLLDENGRVIPDQKKVWSDQLTDFENDILIVGHTHQIFAEMLGDTLVINPGSTKFNHACAILSLPDMSFQVVPLSGRRPLTVWNWGIFRASG